MTKKQKELLQKAIDTHVSRHPDSPIPTLKHSEIRGGRAGFYRFWLANEQGQIATGSYGTPPEPKPKVGWGNHTVTAT